MILTDFPVRLAEIRIWKICIFKWSIENLTSYTSPELELEVNKLI